MIATLSFSLLAQKKIKFNYKSASKKQSANYFKIVEKKDKEVNSYNLKDINDLKEYKHYNRWKEYWRLRVKPDGTFTNENLSFYNAGIIDANGKLKNTVSSKSVNQLTRWSNIGAQDITNTNGYPNFPQMGRLNAFLRIAHPSDKTKDVLFVGAPNGGLWKSTDGGAT